MPQEEPRRPAPRRRQISFESSAAVDAALDRLVERESARTGTPPDRLKAPVIRGLILAADAAAAD